ncbi:MAG TPA: multicopper oxidase domain-containing protein [Myxococcota bacterium]|nr:multicopper oxidase domain-containing protein [Myxococcota bacterium]HRY96380.1 multicopper oxidase domain-containing protein [Myxococcota bacterium]HSA20815.1 multicopper oxidase domain-containing protein [Myxococcota bacterium]
MNPRILSRLHLGLAALALLLAVAPAQAAIPGLEGTAFWLVAREDVLSTPDGGAFLFWGLAPDGTLTQYPGPTLIVPQGATVSVQLTNELPVATSLTFPGQRGVQAVGGAPGPLAQEAAPGETVTYTFVAEAAGTYLYQAGSRPDLQIEMGLVGALIVRPAGFNPLSPQAYPSADTAYERENLFLLTELDMRVHDMVLFEGPLAPGLDALLADFQPVYWFINGRAAPDTMADDLVPWLPTQPYGAMTHTMPGERLLMRVIGAGRDLHPFHHHGNHARVIARDGQLLSSAVGAGADLAMDVFTVQSVPGATTDAIFSWTGEKLGWDIYGTEVAHDCMDHDGDQFDDHTREYCPDHGKVLPTVMPGDQEMAYGGFWSGSPFLSAGAELPPGEGGLNPGGAFVHMWHSHTEREMTNNDVFPGGMMTMLMVEAPGTPMP